MSSDASPWVRYWNDQTFIDDAMLARSSRVFLEASEGVMAFSDQDRVLDIGCGSGALVWALAPRVREICGLDTSQRRVEACRDRFPACGNVTIEQLVERYTDFSVVGERKFDKIVCLSVIQYYGRKDDVRALIREVKRVAAPGARFLIGDILIEASLAQDVLSLLWSAIQDGEPVKVLKFLWRARCSEYGRLRRDIGLLTFRKNELLTMAKGERVKAEVIDRLTVNRNRSNLLISF